jgi:hypothetical protein
MERVALPSHLQGVFFDTVWETSKVWSLRTPVSMLTLDELEWQLDLTVWSTVPGQPLFDLSPRLVLSSPDAFAHHWTKVFNADLAHPLELFANRRRWVIVDGYHRLTKHWLRSSSSVPVRLHSASLWGRVRPGADPTSWGTTSRLLG